ncbi:MAG: TIGR03960 family B12-binding radical SAM protein, partial [Coriobacteriales bacterium]|nr:TIGR03960 family B12-binding radical SAM protein [Coriobacteriales bacterium]
LDAFFIGVGEELDLKVAQLHNRLKKAGVSRDEILKEISKVEGMHVPKFHYCNSSGSVESSDNSYRLNTTIQKCIVKDFDATPALDNIIVPFCETVQDRLSIEIIRGCSRGCRFCQAGSIYRPVRERSANSIIKETLLGLAKSGYEEVSLMSLSSTDHSNIEEILRQLNCALKNRAIKVSIPSQRVDSLDISLARLIAGQKKGSMTLAPEAGSQKMRDVINKQLSEQNILDACLSAFNGGWKKIKLYFMIGLPFEQDEDVEAIGKLCNKILKYADEKLDKKTRSGIGLSLSCAIFIPKPTTPFQYLGQISLDESRRRINILKDSFKDKRIDFHYHENRTSLIEACIARADQSVFDLVYKAWKNGARFDAWSDQFNAEAWETAQKECNILLSDFAYASYDIEKELPWDFISSALDKKFLVDEFYKAQQCLTTADCTFDNCTNCGACQNLNAKLCIDKGKRVKTNL